MNEVPEALCAEFTWISAWKWTLGDQSDSDDALTRVPSVESVERQAVDMPSRWRSMRLDAEA